MKHLSPRLESRGVKIALHKKTGLGRQTLNRWLAGVRVPDLDQVQQVADFFEVDPVDLLSGTDLSSASAITVPAPTPTAARPEGTLSPVPDGQDPLREILPILPALYQDELEAILHICRGYLENRSSSSPKKKR